MIKSLNPKNIKLMKKFIENIKLVSIIIAIVLAVYFVIPYSCTRPNDTKRILEQNGYTSVKITGYRPFMATKGDSSSTGFEAISPNGSKVTGAVTGKPIGGYTIRLD